MNRVYFLCIAFAISACSSTPLSCKPATTAGDVVYVVEHGWHAEIGIPIEELDKNLQFYRKIFPDARVIMFGYGKKTFFTAPPETISEYFLGPFPGSAVIHTVGIRVTPIEAYSPEDTSILKLSPGGKQALSAYIWKDLAKDIAGKPYVVARSNNPDGLFYAAQSQYNLFHTCNSWTADALHAAGLHLSGQGVIFSGQVIQRVNQAVQYQCHS